MASITVICNDGAYFLRHRRAVVDRLSADGHDVMVLAGGAPLDTKMVQGWTYRHIPIERFSLRVLADAKLLFAVLADCWRRKPEAVHLITLKPAVFGGIGALIAQAVVWSPQRIVVTIPGLGRLMSPTSILDGWTASVSRWLVRGALRTLSRRGAYFTFETERDRQEWADRRIVNSANSEVISGAGVDPRTFYPSKVNRDGPMRVLFASRLLGAKGLRAFLEAADLFAGRHEVEFVVAGIDEPLDPDIVRPEELQSYPTISFLGEVTDMASMLRSVDVVCLPSRYGEGIPRILIEAAASGNAMIATDLPGCHEVVRSGTNGLIISPGSAVAIGTAVETYIQSPALLARHKRASRSVFMEKGFSEDAVVGRIQSILLGL